jgi:transposase
MQTARVGEGYGIEATVLYMALELSAQKWLVGFAAGGRRRRVVVAAMDCPSLLDQIAKAKGKLGLAADATVVSCYEAGRDGHWLHRWLVSQGIDNHEIDSASIAGQRRAKRVKTDRVDLEKLLDLLLRVCRGEQEVWREVRVPSAEDEDRQRTYRERGRLLKEHGAHRSRIQSLLVTQGVRMSLCAGFEQHLGQVRRWDGQPLGPELRDELLREWTRYQLVDEQLKALGQRQVALLKQPSQERDVVMMQRLIQLRAVGVQSAWVLVRELFGWRRFANRREVGAAVGLTPTPYNSGQSEREQGISKVGSRRVRTASIELAWMWVYWQPDSALTRWFCSRFGSGKRNRRIGIVALARKLIVALWRFLEHGVVPEGAILKV